MTPEQHKRVKELFDAALDMNPTDQESFLAKSCGDDEIRAEVRCRSPKLWPTLKSMP
jgi:hypothetical protein